MNPAVEGYSSAVVDGLAGDQRPALAADVAAVERLLVHNDELRDAMTDVTVPPSARRAVLGDVLAGKVGAGAARLCAYIAGAVHAQEVPGAVGWVANRLRHVAQGDAGVPEMLGHREARERVGGYAAAIFEDVSVPELEEIEDELFRFARTVAATPELRSALGDRELPAAVRAGVADDLLSGKVHAGTRQLVDYAITGGRARDIVGTLDWLVEQTAIARGWRVARVRSGQDVDAEERRKLEETLSRLAGWPVELQVTVDRALLAGVHVEIGDLQLDATARGRLERLREHVMTGGWTDAGFGRIEREAHRTAGTTAQAGQDDSEGPRS